MSTQDSEYEIKTKEYTVHEGDYMIDVVNNLFEQYNITKNNRALHKAARWILTGGQSNDESNNYFGISGRFGGDTTLKIPKSKIDLLEIICDERIR